MVPAKAACLVGLLAPGWRARRTLSLRRARAAEPAVGLPRWLAAELVLMAVVFGLAAAVAGAARADPPTACPGGAAGSIDTAGQPDRAATRSPRLGGGPRGGSSIGTRASADAR
jgi:hypothetical protein